ncbi:MAG: protein kinase domain-containing protein [Limisphaerales bacterium]
MIARVPPPGTSDLPAAPKPTPRVPDHELLRCIGRGSYGEVWLARSVVGTLRAIKIVYRSSFEDNRPFEREFSGMQKFEPLSRSNDGLVQVLQIGRNDAEGYFYYVMELADDGSVEPPTSALPGGQSAGSPNNSQGRTPPSDPEIYLPRTLALEKMRRGNLGAEECVRIGAALALALDHLHQHGLIHRDIKPSNIIFMKGAPKLADIGLVAELSDARSYVGTEGFIPPEGPNSAQADIYSLGKVLYEVAMGKDRQDFPEPCSELAERPDRKLLVELNAIILKACQSDPKRRYKSARQMHDELMLLRCGRSVREKHASERRVRAMVWVGAVVAGITLAALGLDRWLDWRVRSIQGRSSLINPALIGKIQPRESSAPRETIDLSAYYTAPLDEAWYPGPQENTLAALPKGIQTFAGVKFDSRGLVQLSGQEIHDYGAVIYPRQAQGIPLDRWIRRLHFLEGAVSEAVDGTSIGAYHVQYRSGRTADIPIVYGRDLRALWQPADTSSIVSNSVLSGRARTPPRASATWPCGFTNKPGKTRRRMMRSSTWASIRPWVTARLS